MVRSSNLLSKVLNACMCACVMCMFLGFGFVVLLVESPEDLRRNKGGDVGQSVCSRVGGRRELFSG